MRGLGELLAGIADRQTVARYQDRAVSGVFDDSRQVQPNGIFVAVPGTVTDGREYIGQALERGAAVVVGEKLRERDDALVVNVPDARVALARLAARWHGLDAGRARGMRLAGVTGTNGKTTTAIMLRCIVHAAGLKCGLLGTVRYDLCGRSLVAGVTTPGALQLAAYLAECADAGAAVAALEISSHAIDQRRTAGLRLAAAAFTNISGDHLDYHGTFEDYRAAKARLFAELDESATAVLNRDDEHAAHMARGCRARKVWYALKRDADISASLLDATADGTRFRLRIDGREVELTNALVGAHNVYNALAAAGLARALDLPLEAIAAGLGGVQSIPGRLQRVPCASPADVLVDYAHTDDALHNVLRALKPLARRRLIVVFGCGGDRDRSKRPRMARAAAKLADTIVITTDNPRSEDPHTIITEILAGFDADWRRRVIVEPDRAAAIGAALAAAGAGDVVLIAGKGHETYQILGDRRIHFDDVEVVTRAAAELHYVHRGET